MPISVITRRSLFLGGVAAVAGLTGACDRKDSAQAVDKVTVLTGAGFQGREAPLFVAKDKGWFAAEGLQVQVLPGKGTTENLKNLANGRATFATLDVNGAIIEYAKPDGIKSFKLTAVLHQRNLACFVALANSGIDGPRDLAGKTISYIPGGINHLLFATYAKFADFDPSGVKWVGNPIAPQHAALLAQRKVDAISQFVPAVETVKSVTKQEVVTLPFTNYISDLHGSAIGVATEVARDNPDLVRRFNRALLKGLNHALDYPDEAGQIYAAQKETQGQRVEAAIAEVRGMAGYVKGSANAEIGHFDEGRVARNIAILQGAGTISAGPTPADIISPELVG